MDALKEASQLGVNLYDIYAYVQDGYFYLLRRYLETFYAGCEAKQVYIQLDRLAYSF